MIKFSRQFLGSAQDAYISGQLEEAGRLFRKHILLEPSEVPGYSHLGRVLRDGQDIHRAFRAFVYAAFSSDLTDPSPWSDLARILAQLGNQAGASQLYQWVVGRWPDFQPALVQYATLLLTGADRQAARVYLKKLLALPYLEPDYALELGSLFLEQSAARDARTFFQRALKGSINQRLAGLRGLAVSYARLGDIPKARQYLRTSLVASPEDQEITKVYSLLGAKQVPFEQQRQWCRQALCLTVGDGNILATLGRLSLNRGDFAQAEELSRQCLNVSGHTYDAIELRADMFLKTRRHSELLSLAQAVMAEKHTDNAVWNKLSISLMQTELEDAAIYFTLRTIRQFPDNAVNYYNLGQLYHQIEQIEPAAPWLRKAAILRPNYDRAYNQLSLCTDGEANNVNADRLSRWALFCNPKLATAWLNRGIYNASLGHMQQAFEYFQTAIACKDGNYPDAYYNMSLRLLSIGALKEGYDLYPWRWKSPSFPSKLRGFPQPEWPGPEHANDANVIVYMEQGMGDEVMYSWLFSELQAHTRSLIVECDPRLIPIFARTYDAIKFLPRELEAVKFPQFPVIEYSAPVANTARYFVPEIEALIGAAKAQPVAKGARRMPRLRTDPDRRAHWQNYRQKRFGDKLVIGIAWRSGLNNRIRNRQYLSPEQISAAFGFDVAVVNLQYSYTAQEHAAFSALSKVHHFDFDTPPGIDLTDDLDDLFALIETVDLIISPLISLPWMAAAVGTPSYVFRFDEIGRIWQQLGTDFVPFGPGIELFFRYPNQTWDPAISQIKSELSKLVAQKAEAK
ncbi:MAG: hypothetical protein VW057_02775 [Rhodospirillaceae bacterium]